MTQPMRRVAFALLALFAVLFGNLNYLQVVRADALRRDPRNSRLLVETYARQRGAIVAGGVTLADSVATGDRLVYLRRYGRGDASLARSMAPLTGYQSLVYGSTGIERSYDELLDGSDPRLFVRRLSDLLTGRKRAGGVVTLTIDPELQRIAAAALGGRRGAVVAIEPRTGAIRALVSSPTYDPNSLSSHDPAGIRRAYQALLADRSRPLLARATQATYPPGSTFKLVTAAAALENGLTPESLVDCPTRFHLPLSNDSIGNFGGSSCSASRVTLARAMQHSYNTAFAGLGVQLGAERLQRTAEGFGFGALPQLDVPVVRARMPESIDRPQSALVAIGQFDVRATPLQMAMVGAAIANGGLLMTPYLVQRVSGADLRVLDETTPRALSRAVTAGTAAALSRMMTAVVSAGTGRRAQIPGVAVAGKTGTAEHTPEGSRPHTWFVGFAPAGAPRLAVAVLVEEGGQDDNPTGGRVAAPIAREVLAAGLR